jgi:hypothetical protein
MNKRTDAFILERLHPGNEAVLQVVLKAVQKQCNERLAKGNGSRLLMDPPVRLWKSLGGERGYRRMEEVYVTSMVAHSESDVPEVVGFHSCKRAYGDPKNTLATEGVKFWQYRAQEGEEDFFLGLDLFSASSYGTQNELGQTKVIYVYRVLFVDTPHLSVTACTGCTIKVRPEAACYMLPIAVLNIACTPEMLTTKTQNQAFYGSLVERAISSHASGPSKKKRQMVGSTSSPGGYHKNSLEGAGDFYVEAMRHQAILLSGSIDKFPPPSVFSLPK